MKRRLCLCLGLLSGPGLVVALLASASTALAQSSVAAPGGIPTATKNSATANIFQPQIQAFVKLHIADVIGEDADAQKAARNSLIAECTAGSSASYFDAYGTEINDAVVAAMGKKLPLRMRLNLAVIVEAVARVGHTTRVEPAVILMLKDPMSPVALWGAKAAKSVIEVLVQNPALLTGDKLLPAIPASVASHAKSGFVAESAYAALNLSIPGMSQKQSDPLAAPLITPMLDILQFRVSLYKTMVPDVPEAEASVASFFSRLYVDGQATPAEQRRTVQLLVDFIASAGQQVGSAPKQDREQVVRSLKNLAGALIVVFQQPQANPALVSVNSMSPGTTPASIAQRCMALYPALQTVVPYLTPPPAVTPAPPATAPAAAASHG